VMVAPGTYSITKYGLLVGWHCPKSFLFEAFRSALLGKRISIESGSVGEWGFWASKGFGASQVCKPDSPRLVANTEVFLFQPVATVNDVNCGSVGRFCVTPVSQFFRPNFWNPKMRGASALPGKLGHRAIAAQSELRTVRNRLALSKPLLRGVSGCRAAT
jgi:hypothetical protein